MKYNAEFAFFEGLISPSAFSKTLFSLWCSMANIFLTMPKSYCSVLVYARKKQHRSLIKLTHL